MNQKRIFLIISFFLVAGFIFGWIIFKKNNLFSSKNNINSSSSFKNEDSLKNSKEAKEEILNAWASMAERKDRCRERAAKAIWAEEKIRDMENGFSSKKIPEQGKDTHWRKNRAVRA